jgi:hypothetical protein
MRGTPFFLMLGRPAHQEVRFEGSVLGVGQSIPAGRLTAEVIGTHNTTNTKKNNEISRRYKGSATVLGLSAACDKTLFVAVALPGG